jgi:hypothetical protein
MKVTTNLSETLFGMRFNVTVTNNNTVTLDKEFSEVYAIYC